MTLPIRKALIVYLSPAGRTQHIALVMEKRLKSLDVPATVIDLGRETDVPFILSQLRDAKDNLCLYLGSPVYALHPLPPVMDFVTRLPKAEGGYAVPFVTWGGVSSGTALHTMGKALEEKGYSVLGAAKVLAEHSRMWCDDNPLGKGHPDENDDVMIEALVDTVNAKLKTGHPPGFPLTRLDYQYQNIRERAQKISFEAARAHFAPISFREKLCTQCGLCVEACPIEAITLSPFPVIGPSCISCCNCVRCCPEDAFKVDFSKSIEIVKAMAEKLNERPFSKIFY